MREPELKINAQFMVDGVSETLPITVGDVAWIIFNKQYPVDRAMEDRIREVFRKRTQTPPPHT